MVNYLVNSNVYDDNVVNSNVHGYVVNSNVHGYVVNSNVYCELCSE